MKYFIGKINERVGEMEFSTTIRFKTELEPATVLNMIARDWRLEDADWDESVGGYDHGGVWSAPGYYREITQATFDGLEGSVTEL